MRPHATRRNDWVQLGIGACALVLPPLALGAALYSMLAAPEDDGPPSPAGTETVLRDDRLPAAMLDPPVTAAGAPAAGPQRPAGPSTEDPSGAPAGPASAAPAAAVAVNPPAYAEIAVAPPPAESPPATAAPRRAIHRSAPRQQPQQPQPDFPLRTWLQQVGLLPPSR